MSSQRINIKNIQTDEVIKFKSTKELLRFLNMYKCDLPCYLNKPEAYDIFYIYTPNDYDSTYFTQCKFQNYELPVDIQCKDLLNGRIFNFTSVSDASYKLSLPRDEIEYSLKTGESVRNYIFFENSK